MKTTLHALSGAALLLTMLAAGSAAAQSRASADISHVSYTLIDLDPNDGIAPAISFNGPDPALTSLVRGFLTDAGVAVSDQNQHGAGLYDPVSQYVGNASGGASMAVQSAGQWAGSGASSFSSMRGNGVSLQQVVAYASLENAQFTLTPMTALQLSADTHVSASTETGYAGTSGEGAIGVSGMSFWFQAGGRSSADSAQRSARAYTLWDASRQAYDFVGQASDDATPFKLYLNNLTHASGSGYVSFSVSTSARALTLSDSALISAVPEPGSWIMLLAGLLLMMPARRALAE